MEKDQFSKKKEYWERQVSFYEEELKSKWDDISSNIKEIASVAFASGLITVGVYYGIKMLVELSGKKNKKIIKKGMSRLSSQLEAQVRQLLLLSLLIALKNILNDFLKDIDGE